MCNGSTYDSDSYCLGSNPSSPASCLHGQAVKTLPSQGKIMGSIPIGGATTTGFSGGLFLCFRGMFHLDSVGGHASRHAPWWAAMHPVANSLHPIFQPIQGRRSNPHRQLCIPLTRFERKEMPWGSLPPQSRNPARPVAKPARQGAGLERVSVRRTPPKRGFSFKLGRLRREMCPLQANWGLICRKMQV